MQRRHTPRTRAATVLAAATVVLAACGDDSAEPAAEPPDASLPAPGTDPDPTPPTTDAAPPGDRGFEHPTDADEVVIEIRHEGGFMPVEAVFTQLPTLLVAGDGRRYVQGPQIAIYPGPLLPNVQVDEIGEEGIQSLLELAAEHGLLTEREYAAPDHVADAPDTVVTIGAAGETYVHRAYALGIGGLDGSDAETGDRAELQAFVEAATADLGAEGTAFAPETYLVRAFPVDDLTGYEVEPTVLDWPDEVSLRLADAADCAAVPAAEVGDLFAGASQLTFFVEAGVTYQLAVKPELPGGGC